MITIQLEKITDTVTHEGKAYVFILEADAVKLLQECETKRLLLAKSAADTEKLKYVIFEVIKLLGLTDANGQPDPEILKGDKPYMGPIIKSLVKTTGLLTMSGVSPSAKKELNEKFKFIEHLLPILKKHGG